MKSFTALIFMLIFSYSPVMSQGGWTKITDPLNAVSQYTTFFPYAGASFIDINNDNLPDLHAAPRTLFLNQGNGIYNLTTPFNFNVLVAVSGSSWADLDNDGDNDCVVSCTPSRVFLNNGSGNFTNATTTFPGMQNYGSFACAVGNFNGDRIPDVMLTHAFQFHPGSLEEPCLLYERTDSAISTYQKITGYPFTDLLSNYTNPYWSDYDQDGDMDLFISNGPVNGTTALDLCYKNMKIETGQDTLIRMTSELFAIQQQDGQCYNFIDYDNDGDFDLCLTNYFGAPTRFYEANNGTYNSINTPFTNSTTNIANCWGDYDNDGDLDVIITNDNVITKYYRNDAGTFVYLPEGLTTPTATNGVTNADYDNDGDLDVFFNGVGNNGNTSSVGLYKNDTVAGSRNWINIKLSGTISNRSAIGSLVRLKSVINGLTVWQTREINAQNSFQGQNDLRVHFGLGNSSVIDSIKINWPNGMTESFINILPNRLYKAVEGEGLTEIVVGIINLSLHLPESFKLYQNYPNPFNPSTKIKFDIKSDSENRMSDVKLVIYNGLGKAIETIVDERLSQGSYSVDFNAEGLPSGIYYYKISMGYFSQTKKMILIK